MPTWRWWIENNATDNLSIDIDWDNAYNFGTSLKVTGKLSANADHLTRLYKTMISVESGDKFQLVYQDQYRKFYRSEARNNQCCR